MIRLNRATDIFQRWPLLAFAASAFMLAGAHGFETIGKMPPCALCLHQREAYWAAMAISALGIIATRVNTDRITAQAIALLLALAFFAGASIAGFHVGVEYKWWPGLAECAGGGPYDTSNDLLGALSQNMDVPSCDKVAWSMLGISMAGWNMLISLGLAATSIFVIFSVTGQTTNEDGA
jgi:disulfide bond formation protein DsbB